jgi:uroporphyrinogen decarboxylase
LRILNKEFSNQVPFVQTIFSPLSQAKNLIGGNNLLVHLRQFPDALIEGLEIITESTIKFIDSIKRTGLAGIFLRYSMPVILYYQWMSMIDLGDNSI